MSLKIADCFAMPCAITDCKLHLQNLLKLKLQIASNKHYLMNIMNRPMNSDLHYHIHLIYYITQHCECVTKSQCCILTLVLKYI